MASYEADAYGARVKVREIGLVVLFTLITLGIYNIFWYYFINRELRDFGRAYQDEKLGNSNPVLSVLAVTIGGLLIVPAIVSYWKCTGRIRQAQRIVQEPSLTNGWLIFALYVAGIFTLGLANLGIPAYVQSGLNGMWQKYPPLEPGSQVAQVTAPAAGETAPAATEAEPAATEAAPPTTTEKQ